MKKSLLSSRTLQALAVAGGLALAAPASAQTAANAVWPLTANNNSTVNSANITTGTPVFRRYVLSNGQLPSGTGNMAFQPYSATYGQAFAPAADGGGWSSSSATPPGTGSTPRRRFYEQFTITAVGGAVRVDSVLFNASIFNSAAGKVAVTYSRSNYTTDSASVTGGIGPEISNSTNMVPGGPLPAAGNGTFGVNPTTGTPGDVANNGAILPQMPSTGSVPDQYRFILNGATGVTINAGQTLTVRLHFAVGSSSMGRYVLLRNVILKGRGTASATASALLVKNGLSLSPNPAAERVLVNHPAAKADARVSLYTTTGQKVASLPTQAGSNGTSVDLSKLAAGLYLVEYADAEQRVTGRIIKQ
ncbi:hypothetical protein GCM10023185_13720 [Hymenobacter saemangeumensis]|uniref:Secretion system C-terminal sorting domain-containing protein n=1 Tax=Hymenobacter saemangeumensis TaxID=1084522 RepID=A0ABP8I818_9BACT